jgi:hypothetical protein
LSKDLKNIQKTDVKKGLRDGVIRLLGLLPIAGGVAEGAIDLALDIRDAAFFRNFIAYLFELKGCTDVDREKFLDERAADLTIKNPHDEACGYSETWLRANYAEALPSITAAKIQKIIM